LGLLWMSVDLDFLAFPRGHKIRVHPTY